MHGYEKYIQDVESEKVITCKYIKLAVQRFKSFQNRDDMYFDEKKVDEVIEFIGLMKHFKGASAGQHFILEDWQQFIVAFIFGFCWKSTGYRVCKRILFSVARKNGKSALMIAIALYLMYYGDNASEVALAANSREQATKVCFKTASEFLKSIYNDKIPKYLTLNKSEIVNNKDKSILKVMSNSKKTGDGWNFNCLLFDEFAEQKNNEIYETLDSSMGNRLEPLSIVCSTVSYDLSVPYYQMYQTAIEILNNSKTDDSFLPIIYTLDQDDDFKNPANFIKSNPNMGVSITEESILNSVNKAVNNADSEVAVKTKTFNIWCSSSNTWINNDLILKSTKNLDINDFLNEKYQCFVGIDLASVNDFTAVSYCFKKENKYYFFTDYYLPEYALQVHKNKEFYKKMHYQKYLKLTNGNVTNYDYILADIQRINNKCPIAVVYYDKYNATQFAINATEAGLNLEIFGQNVANFSAPTKEFYRQFLSDNVIIDNNYLTNFCLKNVVIFRDHNENEKPIKQFDASKIDGVISMIQAFAACQDNYYDDSSFELFSF